MSGMLFTRSRTNSLQKATVLASVGTDGIDQKVQVNYRIRKVVGNGSFGVVILANLEDTSEAVAIKQVLHNPKYKTRELEIMRKLSHPNIVKLKFFFYKTEPKKGDIYLNLILEYVPQTLYRAARNYAKQRLQMPVIYIKLYIYQLFRGMSYLHRQGICHRDVKPQNLLIDSEVGILKICDFGSAKTLIKGETNVAYICSRYYRAPELMFGATDYTCSIDIWSVGTVLVELFLGRPIFIGESAVDQLVEIFKVLGTPTQAQIQTMNPKYKNCSFPQLNPLQWTSIFLRPVPNEAIDLIASILKYAPLARPSAQHASSHPFFYELHCATAKLPSGKPLPTLESDSGSWEKEGEAAK